jgi:hypothetical protein
MNPLRKQVRDFVSSCEHLISLHAADRQTLSQDERDMIAYYVAELERLIDRSTARDELRH